MAFVFTLAAVLTVRRNHEEAQERQLAQLAAALHTATEDLRHIEHELERLALERAARPPRLQQASDLHEDYARTSVFEQGRTALSAHLADLRARHQTQQQLYLLARRDREAIEQLEADQRAAYAATLLQQETRRNEDAFLARFPTRTQSRSPAR